MRDVATLGYFEWRRFVHRIAAIRRSPGRVLLWGAYALGIGFFIVSRAMLGAHTHVRAAAQFDARIAACVGGIFAIFFGLTFLTSRTRNVGAFDSLAEARFMALSHMPRPLILGWVQVRASAGLLLRLGISLTFSLGIFVGNVTSGAATLLAICASLLTTYVVCAFPIPIALARGRAVLVYRAVGCAALAVGILAVAREAVLFIVPDAPGANVLARVPTPLIGAFVGALTRGDVRAFLVLLAGAVLATALAIAASRDAFPELYEMTTASVDRLSLRRGTRSAAAVIEERSRARFAKGRARVVTRSTSRVPSGAWVLVWRNWLALRRGRGIGSLVLGLACWYALGIGVGLGFSHGNDIAKSVVFSLLGVATMLAVVGTAFLGQSMALDVQRPLFWLAGSSTLARLTALLASALWRGTLTIGGMVAAGCIAAGRFEFAFGAPFLAAAAIALMQTTGVALYALFPARIDQQGPLALVRVLLTLIVLATPGLMLGGAMLLAGFAHVALPPVAGAGCFALGAFVEAGALLTFAAWRIDAKPEAFGRSAEA